MLKACIYNVSWSMKNLKQFESKENLEITLLVEYIMFMEDL